MNWHHKLLADALQRFLEFEEGYTRLIITTPPRMGKSELASRNLPAYALGMNPELEIIHGSYNQDIINAMSRDVQRIMATDEYRELFPDVEYGERKAQEEFELKQGGKYRARGIGMGVTGRGANVVIIDDYCKSAEDARSQAKRDACWDWFNNDIMTRLEYPNSVLVMATRWHHDDLIGRILEAEPDDWYVLHLPYIYDWDEDQRPPYDHRKEGDPLWPGRQLNPAKEHMPDAKPDHEKQQSVSMDELVRREVAFFESMKTRSPDTIDSLYQGRPTPKSGGLFQKDAVTRYEQHPRVAQMGCAEVWISVDCTFKATKDSDKVAMTVFGVHKDGRILVLDDVHAKLTFTQTKDALLVLHNKWPKAKILIEDKANGPAIMDLLRAALPVPIKMFDPTRHGSKEARAAAAADYWDASYVMLPDEKFCPWVVEYLNDFIGFPGRKYDDRIDAFSQFMLYVKHKKSGTDALKRILGIL